MGSIPVIQARKLYTSMLIAVFSDRVQPTSFLQSFFTEKFSDTRDVTISVQRNLQRIAVDVIRGSEGNRNTFSKSTDKDFTPLYYREYFDATELDVYDRLFGAGEDMISEAAFAKFIEGVAEKLQLCQDKIVVSIERQCSQVFETGIVTVNGGTNINFKRKAASLVDLTDDGGYWNTSVNPFEQIERRINFIREKGKTNAEVFNMVMGSLAWNALLSNEEVKDRNRISEIRLDAIHGPIRNSVGGTLHGEITAGAYKVRLWSYNGFYERVTAGGGPTETPTVTTEYYWPTKKAFIVPDSPYFVIGYGAVPQLLTGGRKIVKGKFVYGDYPDERKATHEFDVKSAPVAIPVAVDQIATMTVLA